MHAKHADVDRLNDLSGLLIGRAFTVLCRLRAGLMKTVYQNALAYELLDAGLMVVQQCGVTVPYGIPRLEIERVVHGLRTML